MKAICITDHSPIYYRGQTGGLGDKLGAINRGDVLDIARIRRDGWSEVDLLVPGSLPPRTVTLFVYTASFKIDKPPVPFTKLALGVNALFSTKYADEALAAGCPFVVTVDNAAGARLLKRKYPDAQIVCRISLPAKTLLPPADVVGKLGVSRDDPSLLFTGLNEDDQLSHFGDDLRKRAAWDVEMAQRIKAISPQATYLAWVYPCACNEDGEAGNCNDIKTLYAPYFNSGLLGVNVHLYSPTANNIYEKNAQGEWKWRWFESRWRMLFECCGFDPTVQSVWSDECGLDEGGVGGFPAHNTTTAQFREWLGEFVEINTAPLVVNGVSYASPFRGGALFQWADSWERPATDGGKWRGYDLYDQRYHDALYEHWGASIPIPPSPPPPPPPTPPPPPVPPPPPPISRPVMLGLHMMGNDPVPLAAKGCSFFLCMGDNSMRAHQTALLYPSKVVMFRRLLGNSRPSAQQMFDLLQVGADSRLVFTGKNEGDSGGYGSPAELRAWAEWDVAIARMVRARAPNAIYAAGAWSVGTPDFANPENVRVFREVYAPAYNAGWLALDFHLYSPSISHIDNDSDLIWHERRWVEVFTKCGFNPAIRAIYSGECGLDTGDVKGFVGNGVNESAFAHWCARFLEIQARPSVAGYPSQFVGGAIYQWGGNGDSRWNTFLMNGYLAPLQTVWAA